MPRASDGIVDDGDGWLFAAVEMPAEIGASYFLDLLEAMAMGLIAQRQLVTNPNSIRSTVDFTMARLKRKIAAFRAQP